MLEKTDFVPDLAMAVNYYEEVGFQTQFSISCLSVEDKTYSIPVYTHTEVQERDAPQHSEVCDGGNQ